jgi:hypothetical protein
MLQAESITYTDTAKGGSRELSSQRYLKGSASTQ